MSEVKENYSFDVDDKEFRVDDDELTGRQVRTIAERDPAGDYRLIEIHDRYTSVVGLEDPIVLKRGEKRVFRSFEGDVDYEFEVNERGWAWGAPSISEAEVRAIGRIAEDREIMVVAVGMGEMVVPRGGMIDLAGKGVERIFSRKRPAPPMPSNIQVDFVINGEPISVSGKPEDKLVTLLEKALKESENTGQEIDAWQVTDEPGNVLEVTKTLHALGIKDGSILLASLKAGAAG